MIRQLRLAYRATAQNDLDQIFWYLTDTTGLPRTARAYVARIEARCERLAKVPSIGRQRDDLCPGLRMVSFERTAMICYVIEAETVWITNVFRRGRDYEAILRGDPESAEDD